MTSTRFCGCGLDSTTTLRPLLSGDSNPVTYELRFSPVKVSAPRAARRLALGSGLIHSRRRIGRSENST
ncbi:hypothetical protein D3C77_734550 [compost metagenome]